MQKQWLSQYWRQGVRAMPPRDVHEHHRASTPLELLFDLVAVIAIAAAAGELHHAVAHGHALEGGGKFMLAFFAIWWVRAPLRLISGQQSCRQLPQARRHSEGIVALFRAVATPHEAIAGAPRRAIAEWPHAALNFLALEPLKLQKSALPAAILLIAAAAN